MRVKPSDLALLVLVVLVLGGAAALWQSQGDTPDPAARKPTPGLSVSATGTVGRAVDGSDQFSVGGDTPVRVGVSRLSGGTVSLVAGPSSSLPEAVQFPPYRATGAYPRAVLSLTPTAGSPSSSSSSLSPGTDAFSYGAVLRFDAAVSSGRAEDNGDNVLQRGLSSEKDLFKLEMDHGRPACTVRGSAGTVIVRAKTKVTRAEWYSVTCSRVGNRVTVSAEPYGVSALATAAPVASRSASGPIGDVSFAADRPASVGGKILPTGAILTTASDQFNGAIAKVWVLPS